MVRRFNPYGSLTGTEPNMRQEFINTMDGAFPEVAKKQTFVFRKMRIDSDGKLDQCPCVDATTVEPDKDAYCPICLGEGLLWDESLVTGYVVTLGSSVGGALKETLADPGNINLRNVSFYFRYNLDINRLIWRPTRKMSESRPVRYGKRYFPDKVVEIFLDADGSPTRPYRRERIYRIGTAIDFRSDNGKLEYWKLDCYEEQVRFLNGPEG